MRFFLVVSVLILAGCRTNGFVGPNMDSAKFYQDYIACEQQTTPQWRFCWGQMCNVQNKQLKRARNHCMGAKGWRLSRSADAFRP